MRLPAAPAAEERLRPLIPRYARLAVVLTWVTAPLVATSTGRMAAVMANAAVALLVAELANRTGLLARWSHRGVAGLLVAFCALIATGSLASGRPEAYQVLQALPVAFGGVFFTSRLRFGLPVAAAGLQYLAGLPLHDPRAPVAAAQLLGLLVLLILAGDLTRVLRAELWSHRALHAVLEAASGSAPVSDVARQGLAATLSGTGWDAGAVLLERGGTLWPAAVIGASETTLESLTRGVGTATTTVSGDVLQTGHPRYVPDCSLLFPPGNRVSLEGLKSLAAVPVSYHDQRIGVLITAQHTRRRAEGGMLERLTEVGAQLGLALGNARAHEQEAAVAERLRELNRRKDEFLAVISHELRTPATSIELAAQTLARNADRLTPTERDDVTAALQNRARELRELIEALLTVNLADSGGLEVRRSPLDWASCLRRWSGAAAARSGREIRVHVPSHRVVSMADSDKVERIVNCLLSNAVKFSPPASPVDVRLIESQESVEVQIVDEGRGIPPELHEAVFDRFFQADSGATRDAGGLGIGLTLARRLAELHGGGLTVHSAGGQGSTFTLVVPRVPIASR